MGNLALSEYEKERLWQNVEANEYAMWEMKKKPCADCKLRWHPSVMTFDHIARTQHKYAAIASIKQWQPKLFQAELKKCSVVCKNCHFIREMKRDLLNSDYAKRTRTQIEDQLALTSAGALISMEQPDRLSER